MNCKPHIAILIFPIFCVSASLVAAAESIPFSLKRGIPEIQVIINDSVKATFAIDTGADHVYVDKTFAEKHGLLSGRTQPMRPTRGANTVSDAKQFHIESMISGDKVFSEISAVAIDLLAQFADTSMGYPDGVLGSYLLRNYPIILDYKKKQINYFKVEKRNFFGAKVPFELRRHLIIVKVILNGNVSAKMMLDTGSSYTILSPALAKALAQPDDGRRKALAKVELDKRHPVKDVEFLVRDISYLVDDFEIEGVLGTTFLKDLTLYINWESKELWIDF